MGIIDKYRQDIKEQCELHNVAKLYVFGSAANNTMNTQSDIDLLVRFSNVDLAKYFINYTSFRDNLQKIFGRKVDLVEEQTLKNPILTKSIERNKQLIYG